MNNYTPIRPVFKISLSALAPIGGAPNFPNLSPHNMACGGGVSAPCWEYRTGGPTLKSRVCWSWKCVEGTMIRRDGPLSSPLPTAPRTPNNRRQPMTLTRLPYRTERCRSGALPSSSATRCICGCVEGFMIRGWGNILHGLTETLRIPANLRSVIGVGASTPCGAVRSEVPSLSPPITRSCRGIMEGFFVWGWGRILPRERWLHDLHPISNRPV